MLQVVCSTSRDGVFWSWEAAFGVPHCICQKPSVCGLSAFFGIILTIPYHSFLVTAMTPSGQCLDRNISQSKGRKREREIEIERERDP